jgi:hypothetical protein
MPFYAKRTQIPPFLAQNPRFSPKTNPNYASFRPKNGFLPKNKPNSKPIQSQFKPNFYRGEAQRRRTKPIFGFVYYK